MLMRYVASKSTNGIRPKSSCSLHQKRSYAVRTYLLHVANLIFEGCIGRDNFNVTHSIDIDVCRDWNVAKFLNTEDPQ